MTHAHLTAIARRGPSVPLRQFLKEDAPTTRQRILDYGCGRGADVTFLRGLGYQAEGYDPHFAPAEPRFKKYPVITCNFVLNVVPDWERRAVLSRIHGMASGKVLIAVRSKAQVDALAKKGRWTPYLDGYFTPKGTFQKGFELPELVNLMNRAGFVAYATLTVKDAECLLCRPYK